MENLIVDRVEKLHEQNVKFLGLLPNDEEISKMNLIGENLLQLSTKSNAYTNAKELFAKIV